MNVRNNRELIAIVDYGLGNLFSIKNACAKVGLQAKITNSKKILLNADAIILPGVGAFGDAIRALENLDLIYLLKDIAESGRPLIGLCLGLQLFFTKSYEFGMHKGLDIISGEVVRFENTRINDRFLKVPQVCWNRIYIPRNDIYDNGKQILSETNLWNGTLLNGIDDGAFMYFVHSYYAIPENESNILAKSTYRDIVFCSAIKKNNIYGFQFHPERSGLNGLKIYKNLKEIIFRR